MAARYALARPAQAQLLPLEEPRSASSARAPTAADLAMPCRSCEQRAEPHRIVYGGLPVAHAYYRCCGSGWVGEWADIRDGDE
jgi:hypothetical protein